MNEGPRRAICDPAGICPDFCPSPGRLLPPPRTALGEGRSCRAGRWGMRRPWPSEPRALAFQRLSTGLVPCPAGRGCRARSPVRPGRRGTPTSGRSAGLCGIKTFASLLQRQPSAGGGAGTARLSAASLPWPIFPPGGPLNSLARRGGAPLGLGPSRSSLWENVPSGLCLGAWELQ